MNTKPKIKELADGIIKGDRSSLARGITLVESKLPEHSKDAQELIKCLNLSVVPKSSMRIGISGSPGVGKSSLIERLGMHCIENENLKVATLTIDPTSNVSGGSILGDKTRMTQLASDPRAFVRPSPSGGLLGGVARGTFLSMSLCERAGYDVVFVESVGVGQSEVQLADLTDIFILCAAPLAGDDLQAMKRGISEMADIILLNKAEEPLNQAAEQALMELKMSQSLKLHPAQVIPVSAWKGTGIKEAWNAIQKLHDNLTETGKLANKRKGQKIQWMKSFVKEELLDRFEGFLEIVGEEKIRNRDNFDPKSLSNEIISNFASLLKK